MSVPGCAHVRVAAPPVSAAAESGTTRAQLFDLGCSAASYGLQLLQCHWRKEGEVEVELNRRQQRE